MAVITWVGGDPGAPNSWNKPGNWSGAKIPAVPASDDDVIINTGTIQPSITVNEPGVLSVTVSAGASITETAVMLLAQFVINAGTITGNGGASGVQMFSAAGTVTNAGTIASDAAGAGVLLRAGGLITNGASGVIEGGVDGILSFGLGTTPGTVTNDGTIQGTGATGTGVLFSDDTGIVNNTLTNSGTIIGKSAAVKFGAGDDRLTLLPGCSFTGLVDGGAGTDTLELAGTVASSLTMLSTSFTNFETLLVDPTARWTVAGSAHGDLGSIAISGLSGLDTIDLTDFAFGAISWTFANNALVLANAATSAQATLHIQGNFSAGDFHLSSDGSSGTAIVLVPPVKPPTPVNTTASPLTVFDTTTNKFIAATGENYTGPVAGLQHEYIINAQHDNLAVTASTPNWFIHTGSGDDAIAVSSGTNVLDGGTGSNFLTGGSGTDVFFVDDRLPGADIWSTVVGFHSGDDATIFGVTPNDFHLAWLDNQGAAGAQGLTGGFTASGKPTANITLAGYSAADLGTRLSVTFGKTADTTGLPGSVYMNIHGN